MAYFENPVDEALFEVMFIEELKRSTKRWFNETNLEDLIMTASSQRNVRLYHYIYRGINAGFDLFCSWIELPANVDTARSEIYRLITKLYGDAPASDTADMNRLQVYMREFYEWVRPHVLLEDTQLTYDQLTYDQVTGAVECPICMCDVDGEAWTCSTCHCHVCRGCMERWTKTGVVMTVIDGQYINNDQKHHTCPTCRAVVF